ncbi:MAG: N-acetylmuramoyl-L-alanine amidase-like domain-containing protein [Parabacteroides sp.]
MNTKTVLWMLGLICMPFVITAQNSEQNESTFNRYMSRMQPMISQPTGDLMVETAKFFLGTPYVASTLEKEPEQLVVNLQELDCMTLVETTTALVRTLRDKDQSFKSFCRHLQEDRYRNGKISDYTDRLHYTTDWIFENQKKGRVKDVNKEIGGKRLPLQLSFMSTHPDSYKQLKDNSIRIQKIAKKEQEISARPHYFIPLNEINAHAGQIHNGDIVCFVTTVKGLDISHVGIIYKTNEKLTFIHASSTNKRVIINEEPLQEYVQSVKKNNGIMIVRPTF